MAENKSKNEHLIVLDGVEILLRPTFENLSLMESRLGGIAYIAWKYGKDFDPQNLSAASNAKSLPPLSDCAWIIFCNQADKKFSVDEIMDMCCSNGMKVATEVMYFVGKMLAGNKVQAEPSENQKKS